MAVFKAQKSDVETTDNRKLIRSESVNNERATQSWLKYVNYFIETTE